MQTPERKEAGLIMLTKMAKQRPKSSKQCIEALLQFAVKADPHVREVAVKASGFSALLVCCLQ